MATKKAVGKRTRGTGRTKEELESFYSLIPEQHGRSICFRAVQCSTRSIGFYCIPVDDDDIGAADDGQLPPELLYGKQPKRIWALLNTTNISRSSTFEARFNFNPGGRKYIKRPQGGRKYIKRPRYFKRPQGGRKYIKKPQGGRKYPKFVKEQAMN
ncbi:hypothetical protein RHGRI_016537 [Rhododendron griersonianum]|uniref:Uncharacterized protein n=1 Tax=Rhododendron griersonianum TaxID=479676 RepID=A0AAV6JUI5_9ERIC|nr:hypothetical protein RHGRI_016537 [Rhododendron griersonianum]